MEVVADNAKNGSPITTSRRSRTQPTGLVAAGGSQPEGTCGGSIPAMSSGNSRTPMCASTWTLRERKRKAACAYRYPASSAAWKKTRHVFHTAGVPPNNGSSIFPIMGSTRNKRAALRNIETVKTIRGALERFQDSCTHFSICPGSSLLGVGTT